MDRLVNALADRFGARLITAPSARAQYAQSEGHHAHRTPSLVAQPETVEDVQLLVKTAAKENWSIVAFGAGTSLEGNAAITHADSLCVDFSRMARILDVSAADLLCVVEPGVTREQLNEDIRATGLFFPVDPGANASLGGMISTRASGTTTVRYGSMRDNIMALKVVTADGRVVSTGTRARKSASGYDLTHLFTGAEGTLGLIVEASLRLHGQPDKILAATWDFGTVEGAVDTVIATIQSGVPIARMELLDEAAIRACNRQSALGLPEKPMLFLEFHGSEASVADQLSLVRLFGEGNGGGQLQFATATEDRNALWKARHQALWAAKNMVPGAVAWITDICVPISQLSDAITRAKTAIEASGLFAPILGHVGDGNFHIFFILQADDRASWDKARIINEAMIDHALSVGGTCTGEHGIGLGKRQAMQREHGTESVATMRRIKDALDPSGLFNPGKIFLD
ncbi:MULTISPECIES: FAD-binding oxidoreductase [unclassified Sphingopyxis]|jgi:D-lactate dehydrogenase (cytochrome)|uniref:FAD-binding oxidoreductase n=1 Tax=unclassified Sphingopyxis TaxID=2614943 RepID=UPI0025F9D903|nr:MULTISPECIES: FAD-linked oxidase C-terminal domain-containing protein [unclassified Sphingopyxis]